MAKQNDIRMVRWNAKRQSEQVGRLFRSSYVPYKGAKSEPIWKIRRDGNVAIVLSASSKDDAIIEAAERGWFPKEFEG